MQTQRILVVDDEPVVTRSCRRILAEEGYDVDTVNSGRAGLDRALKRDFDLVMTDLRMPDLDGMDLVRSLAAGQPATAIIIITGYGSVNSAVEATKLGVSDYIEKPFTPDRVKNAVDEALSARRTTVEPEIRVDHEEAYLIRLILRHAGRDQAYGRRLLYEGRRELAGWALSPEARRAIVSRDVGWIERRCGGLEPDEREWLHKRPW